MATRTHRVGGNTSSRTNTRTATATAAAELPLFASALRHRREADAAAHLDERPDFISTGLGTLDVPLRGGFPVGAVTIVGARPRVGATSLLVGAVLAALKRGERVAYFSERLRQEQLRGRCVVLESRVNGFRFKAGLATDEDHLALTAARDRIPWHNLSVVADRRIMVSDIDRHIFNYRPWLVVADLRPRAPGERGPASTDSVIEGFQRLAQLAQKHQVAIAVRTILNRGGHRPELLELPGLGAAAKACGAVVLLHRDTGANDDGTSYADDVTPTAEMAPGRAEARVVWVGAREVEPREVRLRFDQRFAGLLEV
jgi:predicted ATP-dependent serine protease